MKQNPARIDSQKTAMGAESSFSLTRQAQTNHYDRRIAYKKHIRLKNIMHFQRAAWAIL
jgi:hypothetical protein